MADLNKSLNDFFLSEFKTGFSGKILLACSGGMDSIALAWLFKKNKIDFGIAHCNFQLRGKESDYDEVFVEELAEALKVGFYKERFDTEGKSKEWGLSIQETARKLRYTWLEELRAREHYQFIATAHHLNDSIETLLYNLSKGTGIRGLHGILPLRNKLIRPLSNVKKEDIRNFVAENDISYREDSSNASTKYTRNKIRQELIPAIRKINPSLEDAFLISIQNFRETEWLNDYALELIIKKVLKIDKQHLRIDFEKMKEFPVRLSILHHILNPFGFNRDQYLQMLQVIDHSETQSGKKFQSESHELFVDRTEFILRERLDSAKLTYLIPQTQQTLEFSSGMLSISYLSGNTEPSNDKHKAYLDMSNLSFPLKWRPMKRGDRFQPLGMEKGTQKLSDFLTNQKVSILDKEDTWVLESNKEIVWVAPYRIAHPFRIKPDTRSTILIDWKKD